ncbi:MAG: VWA domain-containing protein [Deltaproteobacteria bacterium]|nr:VWA domain-containing protein [Deltaproteobacteria bacterium]
MSPIQVDFIWVVDNSASMQEEQQALAQAAESFFDSLARTNLDFRLGVISTDGEALRGGSFTSDLGEFRSRVQVGINGNGREQGLEFAARALVRG